MLCSFRLVGSVSGRIPITQNSCLRLQKLLTSCPSTRISHSVALTTTSGLRHGSSSNTFMAKAMQRKESERRFPPQHQDGQPGKEYLMDPLPIFSNPDYKPTNKLQGKVALVTGGDSGIGRAVCYSFAKEGATVAFTYVKGVEDIDAKYTLEILKDIKMSDAGDPIAIPTDVRYDENCKKVVNEVVAKYGRIDILVNNAAVQYETYSLDDITEERLERIFRTNIFSHFFMTRSLAIFLVDKGIRVNGVAPGPVWTPLEAASLNDEDIATFGSEAPLNRAAQPVEIAPSYVFLASEDSSYYTGTFLHPDGGEQDNALPSGNNNNAIESP